MKQFDNLDELNQTFVSMNHKVKLSEKEKGEVFSEIKGKMNDTLLKPNKNPVQWKYFLASVAVALLLIIMVTPLLNNNGKELLGVNEQNPSNSSSDSNPIVSDTKEEYVVVNIINNTDSEIPQLELNIYQYGELIATQGSMNADGSPVKIGDYFEFTFTKDELHGQVSLEAVVIDNLKSYMAKGVAINSSEKVILNVKDDKDYSFELEGYSQSDLYLQNLDQDISIESNEKEQTRDVIIRKEDNEIAATVQEKLTLGLSKGEVESIFGINYYEGNSEYDNNEYWRYDFGGKDYQFPYDDGEIGDIEALSSGIIQAHLYIHWDEEGKTKNYTVAFLNHNDGKVYAYYVFPDGGEKLEIIAE